MAGLRSRVSAASFGEWLSPFRRCSAATGCVFVPHLVPGIHNRSRLAGRCTFASLAHKRRALGSNLEKLPEVHARHELRNFLQAGGPPRKPVETSLLYDQVGLSRADVRLALDAGLATFLLHVESRVAHHCGEGFYTIGPCGEELLAAVGIALRDTDATALHYRHLSTSIARALRAGKPMEDIVLDRARGFCVSARDPVGGGHHCLIGGGPNEFLVTSTLASQAPPAVGRGVGCRLAHALKLPNVPRPRDALSYVSVGDGSINNAHFLSAVNLTEYMQHRGFQCPVVFGISDNGFCISLRGYGWLEKFAEQRLGMPVFRANGTNMAEVYKATTEAAALARSRGCPAAVIFTHIVRRFGHAATDRQEAYLEENEIAAAEDVDSLEGEFARAVQQGITTYSHLLARFDELTGIIEASFDTAASEPKIASRSACMQFNSQPLLSRQAVVKPISASVHSTCPREGAGVVVAAADEHSSKPQVMRKNMTRVYDELLQTHQNAVYIGEDVQHGGYYRITEGLSQKYGWRVADFPPDETSLFGTAIGYAQSGLLPIVEMPYAKYLDCGADMFFEAVALNWLSAGKQPCGMVIRLQGFDKGVFGGNFHTHNSLYLPPGLDVVAYSNGDDYVRGLRHAVAQAAAGRIVMSVDSTDLLNRRHLFDKDNCWMRPYPAETDDVMDFDEVRLYGGGVDLVIVTYGNGVPTALRAKRVLEEEHGLKEITVVDVPYLSGVPSGLVKTLEGAINVVFADVCKMGQHPHAGLVVKLQDQELLPQRWRSVAASPTYNPLGSTVTFLNEKDIVEVALTLL